MSKLNNVKIIEPELSIHKKLGKIKFDQMFDTAIITRAEKIVIQSELLFKDETAKDFEYLKKSFSVLDETDISAADYEKLSETAFSIKSRAATGGYPLASEVANSLYKFCDSASIVLPKDGYKVLKLHIDSLKQVFDGSFQTNDSLKCQKLVNGLEEVSEKLLYR